MTSKTFVNTRCPHCGADPAIVVQISTATLRCQWVIEDPEDGYRPPGLGGHTVLDEETESFTCEDCGKEVSFDHETGIYDEFADYDGPRFEARFSPEAWVRDDAIPVDPQGETTWDCTRFALVNEDHVENMVTFASESIDGPDGIVDNADVFKSDPAAPKWIRDWTGPFTIRVRRYDVEGEAGE
jgi:predicted RNA-binding Zn-ribbon protein involved in translation (DUF1610 family)